MMKRYIQYIVLSMGISVLHSSCSSFLDEVPDNRTEIDSKEKIDELLAGAYPTGTYFLFAESMSDNAADKGPNAITNDRTNTEMFFWRDLNDETEDTPTYYWNACYKAIAQANHALVAAEELEKNNGEDLSPQRGEALLARAYAHFMLVAFWSKPYNPDTADSDPGIPIVLEPETVVLEDYERGTVKEVYEQIEKDLELGLELISDHYEKPKFHFTVNAAKAFASRFYVFKGEWNNVIAYANDVLGSDPAVNLRPWNQETYTGLGTSREYGIQYQSSGEKSNLLIASAKSTYTRLFDDERYALSAGLSTSLFFGNTNPTGGRWSYPVFSSGDYNNNVPKFTEYFITTNISAQTGLAYLMCVLFSYDEVILNRAEALAMTGREDESVRDINSFLSKKTADYSEATHTINKNNIDTFYNAEDNEFSPFYPIPESAESLIKCLSELRRLEFYHEGMRWLDHKRWNMAVTHEDYFGNATVLPKDDPRRELQIPAVARASGISPNPR
ncbi:RagB/SusD family nutrient uptake outer membrane protein [Sinomicrobium oceani]|nr:RagB/SusD family nutrient uptake outer membrane protein [Sinomicrobium oceani]